MNQTPSTVVRPAAQDAAKPFLKWAGGKSQLLAQFAAHYPPDLTAGKITRYAEPFLGGGAVFIALAQQFPLQKVYLSDINPELILVYTVVQRDVDELVTRLTELETAYRTGSDAARHDLFYQVRAAYNAQLGQIDFARYSQDWVPRAAHMIFLNKTCYNGLFRVNAKGHFNVPFGRYKQPTICDPNNLRSVAALLARAELRVAPFDGCREWVDADTFVYFDPPYRPISTTSSFTSYSSSRFDDADQTRLAEFFRDLAQTKQAKLMLSNSDPTSINPADDFFARLYQGFHIHRVWASRMINSQADKRGKIAELLITNY